MYTCHNSLYGAQYIATVVNLTKRICVFYNKFTLNTIAQVKVNCMGVVLVNSSRSQYICDTSFFFII